MNHDLFVGRERELGRLREAFEAACQGEARVVAIAGEPGIGKTRLAEELERHARERGALVFWGRVRETAGAPPYWPWIQVGRALGEALGPEELTDLLAAGAVELQRLFPGLRELLPDLPPPSAALDAQSARFRLFEALTATYRRLCERQPVVLVLDDLQWADAATLLLLQHLAAEVAGSRLLIAALYRDGEVEPEHPLGATLAELTRLTGFERIVLRGLSEEETAQYVRATSDVSPAAELERRIHELAEGNPFFTREVVDLLSEQGALAGEPLAPLPLPAGVREVLRRHLERVSDEARELLRTAAVIGREFTHDTLALLAESEGVDLVPLLEEGLRSRVIEETEEAGRYRFVHALMHETLLADIAAPRRALMHAQVGEALERRWGERADRYASRLAPHFTEAAALGQGLAEKALRYSRLAGEQAETQFAWAEAAAHYERCVELLDVRGGDAVSAVDLLRRQARVRRSFGDFERAWGALVRAVDLARSAGEPIAQARAALDASAQPFVPLEMRRTVVADALEALGNQDTHLRARLLVWEGPGLFNGATPIGPGDAPRIAASIEEAARLGDEYQYRDVQVLAEASRLGLEGRTMVQYDPASVVSLIDRFRELRHEMLQHGLFYEALPAMLGELNVSAMTGDLDFIDQNSRIVETEGRRLGITTLVQCAQSFQAIVPFARGDLDASKVPFPMFHVFWKVLELTARGEIEAALQVPPFPILGEAIRWMALGPRPALLFRAGREMEARQALDAFWSWNEANAGDQWNRWRGLELVSDALAVIGPPERTRAAYETLVAGPRCSGLIEHSLDRACGVLSLALGRLDDAEQHFLDGLTWCERERIPVHAGRCLLGLAEIAELRGNREDALAQLDRASALFEQYGAQLYLDDAKAMRERIEASSRGPVYPDGLSAREVEVLRLVAAGKSNREIAEQLVLSVRTVERHVANIYAKADLHGRAEAAAYALRHRLDAGEPTAT